MCNSHSKLLRLASLVCLISIGLSNESSAQNENFIEELAVSSRGDEAVGVASQIYKYDEINEQRLDFLTSTDANGYKDLNEYCDPEDHIIAYPNDDGVYTPSRPEECSNIVLLKVRFYEEDYEIAAKAEKAERNEAYGTASAYYAELAIRALNYDADLAYRAGARAYANLGRALGVEDALIFDSEKGDHINPEIFDALRAYQKGQNLDATGVIDRPTLERFTGKSIDSILGSKESFTGQHDYPFKIPGFEEPQSHEIHPIEPEWFQTPTEPGAQLQGPMRQPSNLICRVDLMNGLCDMLESARPGGSCTCTLDNGGLVYGTVILTGDYITPRRIPYFEFPGEYQLPADNP